MNPRSKPDVDGEYELQLDVSVENSTQTETSYVTIVSDGTQRGANVEVDAGKDQFAANNSNVQINQSNDTIIQGDVYYIWQVVNVPDDNVKQQIEQIQPQQGVVQALNFQPGVQGDYQFRLIAQDDSQAVLTADDVTIKVGDGNSIPVANAGTDKNSNVNQTVVLAGSGYDADNDPLSFTWYFTSKPHSSGAALVNPNSANVSFEADVSGTYVVTLKG